MNNETIPLQRQAQQTVGISTKRLDKYNGTEDQATYTHQCQKKASAMGEELKKSVADNFLSR